MRYVALSVLFLMACGDDTAVTPDGPAIDAPRTDGHVDGPAIDAPAIDAPAIDAPAVDAPNIDAPEPDAAMPDARAPTCNDGVQNGNETDIDCGGGSCAPCQNGRHCLVGGDCISGNCNSSHVCQ
jgi:hypothetical protein